MTPEQIEKMKATRKAHKEAQQKRFQDSINEKAAIRAALMNVINNPDADPADVVRAAELLQNG